MKIPDEIYKKILKSRKLALKARDLSNDIGEFLRKIHPDLEEEMRKGHSFLDEMMDYGEFFSKEESELQIAEALKVLKEEGK